MKPQITTERVVWLVHYGTGGTTVLERSAVPVGRITRIEGTTPCTLNNSGDWGAYALVYVEGERHPLTTMHLLNDLLPLLGEEVFVPVRNDLDADAVCWEQPWDV